MRNQRSSAAASGLFQGMAMAWGDTSYLREQRRRTSQADPIVESWSIVGDCIAHEMAEMDETIQTSSGSSRLR